MERIIRLIKQDKLRLEALTCVRRLDLPQCYLAAGFVRNLVWDHLHHRTVPTPLKDVDVIYFDADESDPERVPQLEAKLKGMMPQCNWQVRNQARMHVRNGDRPYLSTVDAMRYWPEKETAVAIRQVGRQPMHQTGEIQYECMSYECIAAFGVESLFRLQITHNPNRSRDVFEHRVKSKGWLTQWPNLIVVY